jgi:HEAT repeat protein
MCRRYRVLITLLVILAGCSRSTDQAEEYYRLGKYDLAFKTANQAYTKDKTNASAAVILWKSQIAARNCSTKDVVEKAFNAIRSKISEWDETIIPPLSEALNDNKGCVRLFAVYSLGDLPFDEAADHVLDVLRGNLSPAENPGHIDMETLRGEAALILGKRVYEPAYDEIIDLTKSESGYLRARAAESLGYMGKSEAIPLLQELLDDEFTMEGRPIVADAADMSIKLLEEE